MRKRHTLIALALCAALPSMAQGVEEPDTIVSNNGWELPGGTLVQPQEEHKEWRTATGEEAEAAPASRRRSITSRATGRGDGWNSLSVSYGKQKISHTALDDGMNVVSVGYKRGIRLGKAPWFAEGGLTLSCAWGENSSAWFGWYHDRAKFRMGALETRGDILYRWRPGKGAFALEPWAGFAFVSYVHGTMKTDMGYNVDNIFSKDVEYHLQSFVARLAGGVNVCFDDLYVGVSYTFDVNEFQTDAGCRSRLLEATLGVRF